MADKGLVDNEPSFSSRFLFLVLSMPLGPRRSKFEAKGSPAAANARTSGRSRKLGNRRIPRALATSSQVLVGQQQSDAKYSKRSRN